MVEKSPSDTASIPAATKIASVPAPSLGALKLIVPKTLPEAISVSPVSNVKTHPTPEFPVVEVFLIFSPVSATCVKVTSLSAPNDKTEASDINLKSSPTDKSFAMPAPPATIKAPVVAVDDSVVSLIFTTPPNLEVPAPTCKAKALPFVIVA